MSLVVVSLKLFLSSTAEAGLNLERGRSCFSDTDLQREGGREEGGRLLIASFPGLPHVQERTIISYNAERALACWENLERSYFVHTLHHTFVHTPHLWISERGPRAMPMAISWLCF